MNETNEPADHPIRAFWHEMLLRVEKSTGIICKLSIGMGKEKLQVFIHLAKEWTG